MILRMASFLATTLLTMFAVPAAHAQVLEIGTDGSARWVGTGAPANAVGPAQPLSEVPLDVASGVPESIVANTQLHASGVPAVYAATIAELAARYDLSPALLEAVIWQESRWRENAVSSAGARGLAQLMPGTARYLGVDPDDPFANLEGGARYLREQLDRFDGDLELALAAYNAGPARVIRSGGIPRIRETQNYVDLDHGAARRSLTGVKNNLANRFSQSLAVIPGPCKSLPPRWRRCRRNDPAGSGPIVNALALAAGIRCSAMLATAVAVMAVAAVGFMMLTGRRELALSAQP